MADERVAELQEQEQQEQEQQEEQQEDASLRAFVASSDQIVAKTVLQYVDFVRRQRRTVDARKWLKLKSERGVDLYKERVDPRAAASAAQTPVSPDEAEKKKRALESFSRLKSTMVSAFGCGTLPGTLESVMEGLYADTTQQMQRNAEIQYGNVLDCGVDRTFRTRSDGNPHEFFGVKYLEKFGHIPGVIDQLCWVERMGTIVTAGRRFGFQLIKSVETDDGQRCSDQSVRRVDMSVCYLYCQAKRDVVDVFLRGIVELPSGTKSRRRREAVSAAGDYILATIRGRECLRMKTIASLIEKSKTEREQLTACHCSKVIRGLEKVEMCSGCREAMRRPKLVAISNADDRKRGTDASSESSPCSARLQSRYGSTRSDGELPAELAERSYRESESFRMLLPIRDPRPASDYRVSRKRRENVLITMLRRHERKRREEVATSSA